MSDIFDLLPELDDFVLSQAATEMEDDIMLTQLATKLEDEYLEDLLGCQAGDRSDQMPNVSARDSESYVANWNFGHNEAFNSDFDIFKAVSFDLGIILDDDENQAGNENDGNVNAGSVHNERFTETVSDQEIQDLINSQTNANTKKNTKWAIGAFNDWRLARASDNIPELHAMDAESMNFWLQRFVMEARKQKGGEYPPKSLYFLVCGLLRHCRDMNVDDKNFLDEKDGRFTQFRRVLDAKMKELLCKGLGTKTRRADPISPHDEEVLWTNGIFGMESSVTLQYTVFFYNCKLFGLRGRDEHRNLDFSQFEIGQDATGKFLRFTGRNSKTFQGGMSRMKLTNKDIKHYAEDVPRCIIKYFEAYLRAVSVGVFYRKPLNSDGKDRVRYGKTPLGVNKLNNLMRELCEKGGLIGNFTNHSGKRTCATALYQAGIDEQEIMERTGHRSNAVRVNKTSNSEMQKNVSSVLNPPKTEENDENANINVYCRPEKARKPEMSEDTCGIKKRCLNDVTNIHGSPVSFSNCHFSFS